MANETLIGFDFGTKSIGVAVGQQLTGTALALKALKAQNGKPDWNQIEKLLKEWLPDYVVVGLPLNMDGTKQQLTVQANKFVKHLQCRFSVQVELQDERLSTVEARTILFERGGYRALQKAKVDSQSAVIILQDWFKTY